MRRRILLDENIPKGLRLHLEPHKHYIKLAREVGLEGTKNGILLRLIERLQAWDVFISNDLSLPYQHNRKLLRSLSYSIIIVGAESNDLEDYLPFAPKLRYLINRATAGDLYILRSGKTR